MAHVFLSYSKSDRELTEKLADQIASRGYSVWWDTELIAGEKFENVIPEQLMAAKAVVVVWTSASVVSDWVRSEARRGAVTKKLISLKVSELAIDQIPMPFDGYHTENINNFDRICRALDGLISLPETDHAATLTDAQEYFEKALEAHGEGDFNRAIADYTNAIESDPEFVQAYNIRGIAHETRGDSARAIADHRKAFEIDPDLALAHRNRLAASTKCEVDDIEQILPTEVRGSKEQALTGTAADRSMIPSASNVLLIFCDQRRKPDWQPRIKEQLLTTEDVDVKVIAYSYIPICLDLSA